MTPCASAFAAAALTYAAWQEAGFTGRWVNPSRSVVMVVAPCGGLLCGTVEWASDKAKADSRRGTEELVGTKLLTDVEQSAPGKWAGILFVPDARVTVTAKIELLSEQQLKVSGCLARHAICKSQIWTRANRATQP